MQNLQQHIISNSQLVDHDNELKVLCDKVSKKNNC